MSQLNIRKAFEKKMIAFSPAISLSFENVSFTPASNVPYAALTLSPADVRNPTLGDNYHREVGLFQVLLCFPIGQGTNAVATKAEEIKLYFKRGTTLTESDTVVIVDKTPSIGRAYVENNRLCIPVRVSYFTNEF